MSGIKAYVRFLTILFILSMIAFQRDVYMPLLLRFIIYHMFISSLCIKKEISHSVYTILFYMMLSVTLLYMGFRYTSEDIILLNIMFMSMENLFLKISDGTYIYNMVMILSTHIIMDNNMEITATFILMERILMMILMLRYREGLQDHHVILNVLTIVTYILGKVWMLYSFIGVILNSTLLYGSIYTLVMISCIMYSSDWFANSFLERT